MPAPLAYCSRRVMLRYGLCPPTDRPVFGLDVLGRPVGGLEPLGVFIATPVPGLEA